MITFNAIERSIFDTANNPVATSKYFRLYVKLSPKGKSIRAKLDTGAELSIIPSNMRDELGVGAKFIGRVLVKGFVQKPESSRRILRLRKRKSSEEIFDLYHVPIYIEDFTLFPDDRTLVVPAAIPSSPDCEVNFLLGMAGFADQCKLFLDATKGNGFGAFLEDKLYDAPFWDVSYWF